MSLRRSLQFALAAVVASVALALGTAAGAAPNPDYTAPPPQAETINATPPAPGTPASGVLSNQAAQSAGAARPARSGAAAAAAGRTVSPQAARASGTATGAAVRGRQQLAITGSDAVQLAVLGGLLVAAGGVTMALRRRTATA